MNPFQSLVLQANYGDTQILDMVYRCAPIGENAASALHIDGARWPIYAFRMQEWDVLDEVSLLEDSAGPADAAATLSHEQVAICWRGDCKYFATLLQQQSQQQPQQTGGQVRQQAVSAGPAATGQPGMAVTALKVWLRSSCKLHAIGEGADGLLPVGCLQNSSCLIGLRVIMVFHLAKCFEHQHLLRLVHA